MYDSPKKWLLSVAIMLLSMGFYAQDTSYYNAKQEMEEEFGTFPTVFEVFPDHALSGAWENFKKLNGP